MNYEENKLIKINNYKNRKHFIQIKIHHFFLQTKFFSFFGNENIC